MDKAIIGAVLKNRIKQMGYTQEEFADKCGIGLASLKKYIKGENVYNYELMEIFAEKLNCSYDYLMGKSISPERKYQDVSNAIRLSDEAIDTLMSHAKNVNKKDRSKMFIETMNVLIQSEELVDFLGMYLMVNKELVSNANAFSSVMDKVIDIAFSQNKETKDLYEENSMMGIEDMLLIELVARLKDARQKVNNELIKDTAKIVRTVKTEISLLGKQDE